MLHIDGAYGEGGGQILRYAVALSAYTKKPITITNIRAKRENPGLRPQHFTALSCIKKICNAETEGLKIGSKEIEFYPGEIQPGTYSFDIGTAGSICLVFQTCILGLLQTPEPITIQLTGGTDVRWAPTWDYFTTIFQLILQKMGISIESTLSKRGYYPTGGGQASITIHPVESIKQIKFDTNKSYTTLKGRITSSQLPDHINKRIKHTIIQQSIKHNLECFIQTNFSDASSPGVVVSLWTSSPNIIGTTVLGKKGISSEQIALRAFQHIMDEIKNNATIDRYAIDQILPYMVLAQENTICRISCISNHTKTTMWLLEQFFNIQFSVNKRDKTIDLLVK
ncbi:MAG: RNA 3'-terminal phosphate cyclase [Thermoplasmatota archaeon]